MVTISEGQVCVLVRLKLLAISIGLPLNLPSKISFLNQTSMTTKKKAGGRPKLAEYQKRTKSCQVMFNESDYIYVMDKAQRCGLTISEYCHQAAMDGAVKEHIQPEQAALIRDIAGVTNNVNQIAHKMHAFGLEETYHSCQEIINVLLNLINESK